MFRSEVVRIDELYARCTVPAAIAAEQGVEIVEHVVLTANAFTQSKYGISRTVRVVLDLIP